MDTKDYICTIRYTNSMVKVNFSVGQYGLLGILFAAVVIWLLILRGCENTRQSIGQNDSLLKINEQLRADSATAADRIAFYEKGREMSDGAIALMDNQISVLKLSNDSLIRRINTLQARHVPMKPSSDTSITVVPNEYINDCEGCFTELNNSRQAIEVYRNVIAGLRGAFSGRRFLDSNEIAKCHQQTNDLQQTVKDAIAAGNAIKSNIEPKGQLFFSMSTMAIKGWWPNAAGVGLAYQDKRKKMYSAKIYASEYGTIKQAELILPLSFKRKK